MLHSYPPIPFIARPHAAQLHPPISMPHTPLVSRCIAGPLLLLLQLHEFSHAVSVVSSHDRPTTNAWTHTRRAVVAPATASYVPPSPTTTAAEDEIAVSQFGRFEFAVTLLATPDNPFALTASTVSVLFTAPSAPGPPLQHRLHKQRQQQHPGSKRQEQQQHPRQTVSHQAQARQWGDHHTLAGVLQVVPFFYQNYTRRQATDGSEVLTPSDAAQYLVRFSPEQLGRYVPTCPHTLLRVGATARHRPCYR